MAKVLMKEASGTSSDKTPTGRKAMLLITISVSVEKKLFYYYDDAENTVIIS